MMQRYNEICARNIIPHLNEPRRGVVLQHSGLLAPPASILHSQPTSSILCESMPLTPAASPSVQSGGNLSPATTTMVLPSDLSLLFDAVETRRCTLNADSCSRSFSPIQTLVEPIEVIESTCQTYLDERLNANSLGYQTGDSKNSSPSDPQSSSVNDEVVQRIFQRQTEINHTLNALTAQLTDLLYEEWAITGRIPKEYRVVCTKPVHDTSFPLSKRLINRANTISHSTARKFDNQSSLLTELDEQIEKICLSQCPNQPLSYSSQATAVPQSYWSCGIPRGPSTCADNQNRPTTDFEALLGGYKQQRCVYGDNVHSTSVSKLDRDDTCTNSVDRHSMQGSMVDAQTATDSLSGWSGQLERECIDQDADYHRKLLQYARYELDLRRLEVDWAVLTELHAVHKKRASETKLEAYKVAYKSNARKLQEILTYMKRIRENMAELNLTKMKSHPAVMPFNYDNISVGNRQRRLNNSLRLRNTDGSHGSSNQQDVDKKCNLYFSDMCHARSSPATPNRRVSKHRNALFGVLQPPASLVTSDSCQSIDCSASGANSTGSVGFTDPDNTLDRKLSRSSTGKPRRVSLVSFMQFMKTMRSRTRSPTNGSLKQTHTVTETLEAGYLEKKRVTKPRRREANRETLRCRDWIVDNTEKQVKSSNAVPLVDSTSEFRRPIRLLSRCKSMPVRLPQTLQHCPIDTHNERDRLPSGSLRVEEYVCRNLQPLAMKSDALKKEDCVFRYHHGDMKADCGQRLTSSPLTGRLQRMTPFEQTISMLPLRTTCVANESTVNSTTNLSQYTQSHTVGATKVSQLSSISSNCSTSGCSCLSSPTTVSSQLALPQPCGCQLADHQMDSTQLEKCTPVSETFELVSPSAATPIPNCKSDCDTAQPKLSVQLRSPELRGRCRIDPCRHAQQPGQLPSDLEVKCMCSCILLHSDRDLYSVCRGESQEDYSTSRCSSISTAGSENTNTRITPVTNHNPKRISLKPFRIFRPSVTKTNLDTVAVQENLSKLRRMSVSLPRHKRLPRHSLLPSHPSNSLLDTQSDSSSACHANQSCHQKSDDLTGNVIPDRASFRSIRRSLWPGRKFRYSIRTAMHPLKHRKTITLAPYPSQHLTHEPVIKHVTRDPCSNL